MIGVVLHFVKQSRDGRLPAMVPDDVAARLRRPEFPRAASYDAEWVLDHQMGPSCVWLVDALTQRLTPHAGSRVLDLGCGRALTSVFLAREFDVDVVAHDWWIAPDENRARIEAAGLADRVHAMRAEAHALPFANDEFDAVLSVDAYHYFGTDDLYLAHVARLLPPDGRLGVVVPGLREEPVVIPPPHLAPHWEWEFCSFHSPAWWQRHWQKTGLVRDVRAEWLADGHALWRAWEGITTDYAHANGREPHLSSTLLLEADHDEQLGFVILTARK